MGSPQADARSAQVPKHASGRALPSTIATMTYPRAYRRPGLGPPSQSASVDAPSRLADQRRHAFTVRIRTGNQNQTSFYPSVPHEISVLVELILGHLRYLLTDVPPQPNSPPDNVFRPDRPAEASLGSKKRGNAPPPIHGISKITLKVVVFHFRRFRLPLILHLSSHFTKSD
ncbi:hypothetical protein AAHE18_18G184200 [Arachis hypogaea]